MVMCKQKLVWQEMSILSNSIERQKCLLSIVWKIIESLKVFFIRKPSTLNQSSLNNTSEICDPRSRLLHD